MDGIWLHPSDAVLTPRVSFVFNVGVMVTRIEVPPYQALVVTEMVCDWQVKYVPNFHAGFHAHVIPRANRRCGVVCPICFSDQTEEIRKCCAPGKFTFFDPVQLFPTISTRSSAAMRIFRDALPWPFPSSLPPSLQCRDGRSRGPPTPCPPPPPQHRTLPGCEGRGNSTIGARRSRCVRVGRGILVPPPQQEPPLLNRWSESPRREWGFSSLGG